MCNYVSPEETGCCRVTTESKTYCTFHSGKSNKSNEDPQTNTDFERAFAELIDAKDGNWQGFVFPNGVSLPKQIDFPIDARWSHFTALDLKEVTFKKAVNFSDAVFLGNVAFRTVIFEKEVKFERCRFQVLSEFLYLQCKESASFYRSEFSSRTVFRANFEGSCNFSETVFGSGAVFSGWRSNLLSSTIDITSIVSPISLQTDTKPSIRQRLVQTTYRTLSWLKSHWIPFKKLSTHAFQKARGWFREIARRFATEDQNTRVFTVFEGGGSLESVVFLKPDQTVFSEADLSRVYFRGTNLRGIRFLGVDWWQPELGRNGLYDELFIRLSKDGPFRYRFLPILEETCRNARVALEENRSFNMASDFYIGEMEAARARRPFLQRHILSVPALYRFVSNYGTSVGTALRVLAYLVILHVALTVLIQSANLTMPLTQGIPELVLRTFKIILAPQIPDAKDNLVQAWADVIFRVFAPIQGAMLVLAFRSRIKRH